MTFCRTYGDTCVVVYSDENGKYIVEANKRYAPALSKSFLSYRAALIFARSFFCS